MTDDIKPTADVYELAAQEFTLDYVAIHAAADVVFAAGYAKGHSDGYNAGAADGATTERARIIAWLKDNLGHHVVVGWLENGGSGPL